MPMKGGLTLAMLLVPGTAWFVSQSKKLGGQEPGL